MTSVCFLVFPFLATNIPFIGAHHAIGLWKQKPEEYFDVTGLFTNSKNWNMFWCGVVFLAFDLLEFFSTTSILIQCRNPMWRIEVIGALFHNKPLLFAASMNIIFFTLFMFTNMWNPFIPTIIKRHMSYIGYPFPENITDDELAKILFEDVCEDDPNKWFS